MCACYPAPTLPYTSYRADAVRCALYRVPSALRRRRLLSYAVNCFRKLFSAAGSRRVCGHQPVRAAYLAHGRAHQSVRCAYPNGCVPLPTASSYAGKHAQIHRGRMSKCIRKACPNPSGKHVQIHKVWRKFWLRLIARFAYVLRSFLDMPP